MNAMRQHGTYLRHAALVGVSAIMLLPFYWVLKTAVTNENIYAYPTFSSDIKHLLGHG